MRHGSGRVNVFIADLFGLSADRAFEGLTGGGDLVCGAVLGGVFEYFPVGSWKLGVDREQNEASSISIRELQGVIHGLCCVGLDVVLFHILLRGKHLFELLSNQKLSDAAARFDV